MEDDLIYFDLPVEKSSIIKVIGIGGGGNNAVNHMFEKGIKDVNFVVCNTDHQALARSQVPVKVQLGASITEGRGAGSKPDVGRQAAMENIDDVMKSIGGNTKMVFLTTGMGGGTGTGAIPVIAKACREAGYLTVAVVTIPFKSEGKVRINYAIEGISHLGEHVDSLLVINNEKLREIYGDLGVSAAFAKADDILATAVKGIAEIITVAGYINVDFADVETVMKDSGVATMGMGMASGEDRALTAIENALASPLLNSNDITGAKSILVNIASGSGGNELTMDELGQITDYMYEVSSEDALIIRGLSQDDSLGEEISVTVIATGFPSNSILTPYKKPKPKRLSFAELHPIPPHIIPDRGKTLSRLFRKPRSRKCRIMMRRSRAGSDSVPARLKK
ncbi:MAG: cell division protein FtsZ [Bacteroidales bacterium]|nr:cell division protein FtsZ [Bacteroidales bacterium]